MKYLEKCLPDFLSKINSDLIQIPVARIFEILELRLQQLNNFNAFIGVKNLPVGFRYSTIRSFWLFFGFILLLMYVFTVIK